MGEGQQRTTCDPMSLADLPMRWSKLTSFIQLENLDLAHQHYRFDMPKWVLICQSCRTEFQQSQVSYSSMDSYSVPLKPELPSNSCTCPSCGHIAAYRRTDWIYRA